MDRDQMIEMYLYMLCVGWNVLAATFLVVCRHYDDRLIGRIALIMIAVSQASVLVDWLNGTEYVVLKSTLWFTGAVALFFAWYLARFYLRQYHDFKTHGHTLKSFFLDRGE